MKKKLGIPKGLYYYYYQSFWQTFFGYLGFDLIISDKYEINMDNTNICPALKQYFADINYLKDKCDYILIPIINQNTSCQSCYNNLNLSSIAKNIFNVKIISYNINSKNELSSLINLGKKFNIDKDYLIECFYKSKEQEFIAKNKMHEDSIIKLYSKKIKILIVGYSYFIHNKYFMKDILKILNQNNIEIIYSDIFNSDNTSFFSNKYIYNLYSNELKNQIDGIDMLKKYINGIIQINTNYCVSSTIINNLVIEKLKVPQITIKIEDYQKIRTLHEFIKTLEEMYRYAR